MHSCKGQPWKSSPLSQWAYCFVCSATWNQIAVSLFHQMKKSTSGIRVALHRNFLSPRLTQVRLWTFKKYEQLGQLKRKINQQPRHFLCPAFKILILCYWKPLCLPMHIKFLKGYTQKSLLLVISNKGKLGWELLSIETVVKLLLLLTHQVFIYLLQQQHVIHLHIKKRKSKEASCISHSFLFPNYLFFCLLWF